MLFIRSIPSAILYLSKASCHAAALFAASRTGLAGMQRAGAYLLDTQWLGLIADAHLRAGQKDAKALLDELG
jgi:hypothetical protein